MMSLCLSSRSAISLLGGLLACSSAHATNWLQFGFDQQHSGYNRTEKGYSTAGNRQLYYVSQPTTADADSALLTDVTTASGVKDLLFMVTSDANVRAIDLADGSLVWSRVASGSGSRTRSAPAIDPNLQFVYVAGLDGKIHKYKVGDGTEILDANWPEISSLKPTVEQHSSALSIATAADGSSYLYAVVNGFGDYGDYQGHITAINLQTGTQRVFNTQCSDLTMHFVDKGTPRVDDCDLLGPTHDHGDGQMSGIWGRPGVVYDQQLDRIYAATGNGLFNANTAGGHEWGDSMLALHPDGGGAGMGWPLDSYTPASFDLLYGSDQDLGSTSPAILPSTSAKYPHLALQGGKDRCLRLINLDDMSGAGGPGHAGGELPLGGACGGITLTEAVFMQPAVWVNPADGTTWAFVPGWYGRLRALQLVVDSAGDVSLVERWTDFGDGSPVVANGMVYYLGEVRPQSSSRALAVSDAVTGQRIWTSNRGAGGPWQGPIVANGRIYYLQDGVQAYLMDGIFRSNFQN